MVFIVFTKSDDWFVGFICVRLHCERKSCCCVRSCCEKIRCCYGMNRYSCFWNWKMIRYNCFWKSFRCCSCLLRMKNCWESSCCGNLMKRSCYNCLLRRRNCLASNCCVSRKRNCCSCLLRKKNYWACNCYGSWRKNCLAYNHFCNWKMNCCYKWGRVWKLRFWYCHQKI